MQQRSRFTAGVGTVCALALAATLAGCGNNYRPVVSAINPVGPAGQPNKYAVAISLPGVGLPGLATVVDFSGDSVQSTPNILTNPNYFVLGAGGSTAYVVNASGSLNSFGVLNPQALLTSSVVQTTLSAGANPASISVYSGNSGTGIYVPQPGRNSVAVLTNSPPSLSQELSVGANPTYVVGTNGAPRVYALSAGNGVTAGQAAAIETTTSSPTISNTLTVGANPVYGVMSADALRAYILNKGSGTVSVINAQTNALDSTTPVIPATGTLGVNPVWAEIAPTLNELLVVNAGNGTTPGTLSIINIPLCNSVSGTANPNCNATNPADAVGFGNVIATVPVGISPSMVTVLSDGSRAYVANTADTAHCGGQGSVSVVNLTSNQVQATICAVTTDTDNNPSFIYGAPNSIVSSFAQPKGKVYVTSGASRFLTVIRTDTDTVETHVPLQGLGLRVLVTAN